MTWPGVEEVLLPRTVYALQGADSTTQEIQLGGVIDVHWDELVTVVVRVHAVSVGAGQRFSLVAQPTASGYLDDRSLSFSTPANETILIIDPGTTAPTVLASDLRLPVPAEVRVLLRATQGLGAPVMSMTVSATLLRRGRCRLRDLLPINPRQLLPT